MVHLKMEVPGLRKRSLIAASALALITVLLLCFAASAKRTSKYVGSSECATCHEDSHPAITAAHAKTKHQLAMTDAVKKPAAVVAVFDADSPFKKSDVRYVLGTGTVYQDYLDKDLKLLPGRWLVKERKWTKIEQVDAVTQCVGCHVTNFEPVARTWTELGVGCEACHGPGAAHSESMEAKDIINLKKLDPAKQNMVCGQCHSQATDASGKYAFSPRFVPGQNLGEFLKLKESCDDAPNSQYNTFLTSKHASTGSTCVTCHDSHGDKAKAAHQLRAPINTGCLGCHNVQIGQTKAVVDLKTHAPDAGADDTCATCHMPGGSHAFKKATGSAVSE